MAVGPFLASVILLLLFYKISNNFMQIDKETEGTELLFTLVVHRHGDRTPEESATIWAPDQPELDRVIKNWGYGQLTNVGRRRGYEIGKFIRKRYNKLLSPTYNRSEIYIRSTDVTRTQMTALTEMAAVYPAGSESWSQDVNWVPVPYTTVPVKYDFNTALMNCPKVVKTFNRLIYSREVNFHDKYKELSVTLADIYRRNITTAGDMLQLHEVYESMSSLGLNLDPRITKSVKHDLNSAAGEVMDLVFGNEKLIALEAGVLLNEFFQAAMSVIVGNDTERVRIHSAHDVNVYTLQAVTSVPKQGVPKYGAMYALELRRVVETGKYVVLPVYIPSPEEKPMYLQVKGCDLLCDFNQFHYITSRYILTEDEWRRKCGFREDFELNTIFMERRI